MDLISFSVSSDSSINNITKDNSIQVITCQVKSNNVIHTLEGLLWENKSDTHTAHIHVYPNKNIIITLSLTQNSDKSWSLTKSPVLYKSNSIDPPQFMSFSDFAI